MSRGFLSALLLATLFSANARPVFSADSATPTLSAQSTQNEPPSALVVLNVQEQLGEIDPERLAAIVAKIEEAKKKGWPILLFYRVYLNGANIRSELTDALGDYRKVALKPLLDVIVIDVALQLLELLGEKEKVQEIVVCGMDTDTHVKETVTKLAKNYRVKVLAEACAVAVPAANFDDGRPQDEIDTEHAAAVRNAQIRHIDALKELYAFKNVSVNFTRDELKLMKSQTESIPAIDQFFAKVFGQYAQRKRLGSESSDSGSPSRGPSRRQSEADDWDSKSDDDPHAELRSMTSSDTVYLTERQLEEISTSRRKSQQASWPAFLADFQRRKSQAIGELIEAVRATAGFGVPSPSTTPVPVPGSPAAPRSATGSPFLSISPADYSPEDNGDADDEAEE